MVHANEVLAVLAFVAAVFAVYGFAGLALLRKFVTERAQPIDRVGRVLLAVAGIGTICMLYGRFVEPRWFEVTRTRIETPRLFAGHGGVRIVHLSDLHSDAEPLLEDRLPGIVRSLAPDAIVFTGDAANSPEGVPVFRRCLSELAAIAPTFVVKGNWDTFSYPDIERFEGTGAVELDGNAAAIEVRGVTVRFVGAGFSNGSRIDRALSELPRDGPAVLLYHCPYPDVVSEATAKRVDLFVAGHVHGGQVALPFYGAVITLSRFGKRFERGLYRDADGLGFPLYVNRGIGMEGGPTPRVRFWSRPEVALLELVPAAS